jgi:gluconolactonase
VSAVIAEGVAVPEGPLFLPDGSLLVTEMARHRGCVTRIESDGSIGPIIAATGRPNGLAPAGDAAVWVAESLMPAILLLHLDGRTEVVSTRCGDEPLLWPNDLCVGRDGRLYATDSGVLVTDFLAPDDAVRIDPYTIALDGRVLTIDPLSGDNEIIDRGLRFANGIAFGPDELLYVSETITGNVYRYDVNGDADRELFGNVLDPDRPIEGMGGPDGIAFDVDGNLYVAVSGQGDITVLDRSGTVTRRHRTRGLAPTNVAFGPADARQIYVTDCQYNRVEVIDVTAPGLRLYGSPSTSLGTSDA